MIVTMQQPDVLVSHIQPKIIRNLNFLRRRGKLEGRGEKCIVCVQAHHRGVFDMVPNHRELVVTVGAAVAVCIGRHMFQLTGSACEDGRGHTEKLHHI